MRRVRRARDADRAGRRRHAVLRLQADDQGAGARGRGGRGHVRGRPAAARGRQRDPHAPDGAGDPIEEVIPLGDGRELVVARPDDPEALLDEEAFAAGGDEFLPYWAELWPSGVALARALARRALKGARVVELGCGLGLPSIAAALAGGRPLATDWSADALEATAANAERNGARVETLKVDWREPDALVARGPFDLVLAADVLYEARNREPLLALLPRLGREAWIADPGRATAAPFWAAVEQDYVVTAAEPLVRRLRRRAP